MNKKITTIAVISTILLSISPVVLSEEDKDKNPSVNKQKYTMCAAIRMKEINLKHLKKDPEKYSTHIPEGWTVVSGLGGDGHPKILLCQ
ncbi:MAG: hypothetical protein COA42_19710 [Alteromonadaceae bacterium]|nr:MAG: hypothetical protein COA42_19710 [Alteromonadaceae bacterium]